MSFELPHPEATELVYYGARILREKCTQVRNFDDQLKNVIGLLLEQLRLTKPNGVGLAAPQVGRALAVCVVDLDDEYFPVKSAPIMPLVLVNPKIVWSSKLRVSDTEGCLSIPNIFAPVSRPNSVTVAYQDENGTTKELSADGFFARVLQHEIDHLNGILFTDRVSSARKVGLRGKLRELASSQHS